MNCYIAYLEADSQTYATIVETCRSAGISCESPPSRLILTERLLQSAQSCVLVDVDQHIDDTTTLLAKLHQEFSWLPAIGISCNTRLRHRDVSRTMGIGISDLLILPHDNDVLIEAIKAACKRDGMGEFPPSLMRAKYSKLTTREREVIRLFLKGDNTKIIAKRLGITFQTVDKHRGRALRKFEVRSVSELASHLHIASLTSIGSRLHTQCKPQSVPTPHFDFSSTAAMPQVFQ